MFKFSTTAAALLLAGSANATVLTQDQLLTFLGSGAQTEHFDGIHQFVHPSDPPDTLYTNLGSSLDSTTILPAMDWIGVPAQGPGLVMSGFTLTSGLASPLIWFPNDTTGFPDAIAVGGPIEDKTLILTFASPVDAFGINLVPWGPESPHAQANSDVVEVFGPHGLDYTSDQFQTNSFEAPGTAHYFADSEAGGISEVRIVSTNRPLITDLTFGLDPPARVPEPSTLSLLLGAVLWFAHRQTRRA